MFDKITEVVSNTASKIAFGFEQNKSTICFCGGLAAAGLALFLTGRASFRLRDVVEESQEEIKVIEDRISSERTDEQNEEDKKSINKVRSDTVIRVVKLYIPPVIAATVSAGLLTYSKVTDMKSLAAVSVYALTIQKEFDEYRNNVIARFGDDVDKQLRFNINPDAALPSHDDASNEELCTVLAKETAYEGTKRFLFDSSTSTAWENNAQYNLKFVDITCHTANELLRARGHLCVNEALDLLEMDRIENGFDVGWIYDPDVEYKIDFGIYQRILDDNEEPSFWIELNHDGYIRNRVYGNRKVNKNA